MLCREPSSESSFDASTQLLDNKLRNLAQVFMYFIFILFLVWYMGVLVKGGRRDWEN